jgi:hypothetical protein
MNIISIEVMTEEKFSKMLSLSKSDEMNDDVLIVVESTKNTIFIINDGYNWAKIMDVPNLEDFAINYYYAMALGLQNWYGIIYTNYDWLISEFNKLLKEGLKIFI